MSESDDLYRLTQPSEIERVLLGVQREQKLATLALPGGRKIVTMILDVAANSGHFLYDSGRDSEETRAIMAAERLHFSATLRGVPVQFSTSTAKHAPFEGGSVLRSPLPSEVLYLQRRENFRTKTTLSHTCTAQLSNGAPVSLSIRDISIGGVGLQSATVSPEILAVGSLLRNTVLDFLKFGKLEVMLLVTSHQTVEHGGRPIYLYGCRFEQLPRSSEAAVQRIVFALEQLNRS